jgi:ubiquinone/menaquinone biosynthesis C-methylase UbiE
MGIGKELEKRGHIIGFNEEISKAKGNSADSFFTWFNDSDNAAQAFIKGAWDFSIHIAAPVSNWIDKASEKTVVDLGYGGGRMLAAASRHFRNAIGIDIHNEKNFVLQELKKRGIENVELYKTDGKSIPLEKESVDVVYSFIVLQHVEKIEIFEKYIEESYRVLKSDGLAVLYFGRESNYSLGKSSKLLCFLDRLYENYKLWNGYCEIKARVNEVNLKITLSYAKKIVSKRGFKILKSVVSYKRKLDGLNHYGGQHGLILRKQ